MLITSSIQTKLLKINYRAPPKMLNRIAHYLGDNVLKRIAYKPWDSYVNYGFLSPGGGKKSSHIFVRKYFLMLFYKIEASGVQSWALLRPITSG